MIIVKEEKRTDYVAFVRADVTIKTVVDDRNNTTYYAKGHDFPEYFECRFDSHGNICDADGIVVLPSESGRHPAKRGDIGYFGDFREMYIEDGVTPPEQIRIIESLHPILPSVHDDVYSAEWVALRQKS